MRKENSPTGSQPINPDGMPDHNLKVALIPLDITEADVKTNLDAVSRRLASLDSDTRIVVLPEMFSTGFVTDHDTLARIAETDGGATMYKWFYLFRFL